MSVILKSHYAFTKMACKSSAQRVLRKVTGVMVEHTEERKEEDKKNYYVKIIDTNEKVHYLPDDMLGTNTDVVFAKLYEKAKPVIGPTHSYYRPNTAQVHFGNLNLEAFLAIFDEMLFESSVLPVLKEGKDTKMAAGLELYAAAKESEEPTRSIGLGESLFKIYHRLRSTYNSYQWGYGADDGTALEFDEGFGNPNSTAIRLDAEGPEFSLRMLTRKYPNGGLIPGTNIFKTTKFDPFVLVGTNFSQNDLSAVVIAKQGVRTAVSVPTQEIAVRHPGNSGDSLSQAMGRVIRLKGKPIQKLPSADQDYLEDGGFEEFRQLSGKAKKDHGKICGVGPLTDCLTRLATYIAECSGEPMDHCYHFAAAKIIKMNEKRLYSENGVHSLKQIK